MEIPFNIHKSTSILITLKSQCPMLKAYGKPNNTKNFEYRNDTAQNLNCESRSRLARALKKLLMHVARSRYDLATKSMSRKNIENLPTLSISCLPPL